MVPLSGSTKAFAIGVRGTELFRADHGANDTDGWFGCLGSIGIRHQLCDRVIGNFIGDDSLGLGDFNLSRRGWSLSPFAVVADARKIRNRALYLQVFPKVALLF
jgi:hypothetical protein